MFAVVFVFTPLLTHAATIAELQALIAQLKAQISALQNQTTTTTVTTATPVYINAAAGQLNKAKIKLSYDPSKKESSLGVEQEFSVTTGDQDVYITGANFSLVRKGYDITSSMTWIPN